MACGPILADNMARPTDLVLTQSSGWSVEISKRWADPDLLLFAAIGSWAEVYFASPYSTERPPYLYVTVRMAHCDSLSAVT